MACQAATIMVIPRECQDIAVVQGNTTSGVGGFSPGHSEHPQFGRMPPWEHGGFSLVSCVCFDNWNINVWLIILVLTYFLAVLWFYDINNAGFLDKRHTPDFIDKATRQSNSAHNRERG